MPPSILHQKSLIVRIFLLSAAGVSAPVATATTPMGTGFEDSTLNPFVVQQCCGNSALVVDWGDQARGGSKVAKIQWWADNYENTRTSRGTEVSSESFVEIKEEGWYGFSFWVNASGDNAFNLNTSIGIAQALAHGPDSCPVSWTWILNTSPEGLVLSHRYGMGAWTEAVISPTIPTGRWVDVVFHMKYSEPGVSEGLIEVWFDEDCAGTKGTPTYAKYNIALGLDCWEDDSLVTGTKLKYGMYCHTVDQYVAGEKRVIYFDEVYIIDGNPADAWYRVNPEADDSLTPPAPPSEMAFKVRNGYVQLDWLDNSESDVAGYQIYRSESPGGPYRRLNEALLTVSEYIDEEVTTGTTYHYVGTAVDTSDDESGYGSEVSATHAINMWRDKDIGSVEIGGSVTGDNGNFAIVASGAGIGNTADEFHYTYLSAFGDCEIAARFIAMGNLSDRATAGLMIRETLDPPSANAFLGLSPAGKAVFQRREEENAASIRNTDEGLSIPQWIRLVRSGDTLTGFRSADGVAWTETGTATIAMSAHVYLGLAVSSGVDGIANTAAFDSVRAIGCINPPGTHYLEAEAGSPNAGIQIEDSSEGGKSARYVGSGGWLRFDETDFGTGTVLFRARASNAGTTGNIELRYGRATGPIIAEIAIPHTATTPQWETFTALSSGISGTQRLYLVVNGEGVNTVQLNWLEYTVTDEAPTTFTPIELWRLQHFGSASNSGVGANGMDAEGDRRSNLLEYATGSHPWVADRDSAIVWGATPLPGPRRSTLTFNRIEDPTLIYSVEAEGAITEATWESIWSSIGAQNNPGAVTVEDTEAIGNDSRRFLRLRVTQD